MDALILTIIATSIPLLLAASGELITEKSGVLNLGVEGMMLSGAVGALGAVLWLENPYFGVIAGGMRALTISAEAKEDEKTGAVEALSALLPPIGANDTVLGITSGGTTPYPRGAVTWASSQGAVTGLLTCSPVDAPPGCAHLIIVSTGPEALTGSTRMKAGTATKVKSIFPAFHDE